MFKHQRKVFRTNLPRGNRIFLLQNIESLSVAAWIFFNRLVLVLQSWELDLRKRIIKFFSFCVKRNVLVDKRQLDSKTVKSLRFLVSQGNLINKKVTTIWLSGFLFRKCLLSWKTWIRNTHPLERFHDCTKYIITTTLQCRAHRLKHKLIKSEGVNREAQWRHNSIITCATTSCSSFLANSATPIRCFSWVKLNSCETS